MAKINKKESGQPNSSFDPLLKCEESGKIANFYGFSPVRGPVLGHTAQEMAKKFDPLWSPAEKLALLMEYEKARSKGGSLPGQGLFWIRRPYSSSAKNTNKSGKVRTNKVECELTAVGSAKSVSEGLLLQATRAILENAGYKDFILRINSVGSKESVAEYERRLLAYIKKKFANFPAELRQSLKKDPFYLVTNNEEQYREFKEGAPKTMDYLNEQSRLHFKEILELLETINLPYVIDPSLLGDLEYATETVFEIAESLEEGARTLSRGIRWNRLSKRMDFKKEVPAVSMVINAPCLRPQKESTIRGGNSRFYLIQFGPEAKQKSFLALEELRRAGVSVAHSLAKDKLLSQMSVVEQLNVPYVILIGQKEAIEGNVVIRNSATRAQTIVPIKELSTYIKTIK